MPNESDYIYLTSPLKSTIPEDLTFVNIHTYVNTCAVVSTLFGAALGFRLFRGYFSGWSIDGVDADLHAIRTPP
jgi:hypothetical protein